MTTNVVSHGRGTKAKTDQRLTSPSTPMLGNNKVFRTLCCDKKCCAGSQSEDESEAVSPSVSRFGCKCSPRMPVLFPSDLITIKSTVLSMSFFVSLHEIYFISFFF